jgi:hypothetical protein
MDKSTSNGPARPLASPKNLVCLLVLAAVCGQIAVFVALELWRIDRPFSANYGEGHVLWMAMQSADRHAAYQPVDRVPYVVYVYPPLYLLTARFLNSGDLLTTGRLLSLASALGIALIIAALTFACLPSRFPRAWRAASALTGVAAILGMDSVMTCAPVMRVDMLALLFSFAGLAVFILAGKRQAGQLAAVAFFVLAVFTKQAVFPASAACLAVGLLSSRRETIRAYLCGAIVGAAGLAFFTNFYGHAFLLHIFPYNVAPYSLRLAAIRCGEHLGEAFPLVLIALSMGAGLWHRSSTAPSGWVRFLRRKLRGTSYDRAVIIGCTHAAIAAVWLLSASKHGSDTNYFLDLDIECAFLAGLFTFRCLALCSDRRAPSPIAFAPWLLTPLLLVSAVAQTTIAFAKTPNAPPSRVQEAVETARVVQAVRDTPGPVLSEDVLLSVMAGKPPVAELATVNFLRMEGNWDEQPLVTMLQQKRFGLIVTMGLDPERYSSSMALVIGMAYGPPEHVGQYYLYRPRVVATGTAPHAPEPPNSP